MTDRLPVVHAINTFLDQIEHGEPYTLTVDFDSKKVAGITLQTTTESMKRHWTFNLHFSDLDRLMEEKLILKSQVLSAHPEYMPDPYVPVIIKEKSIYVTAYEVSWIERDLYQRNGYAVYMNNKFYFDFSLSDAWKTGEFAVKHNSSIR